MNTSQDASKDEELPKSQLKPFPRGIRIFGAIVLIALFLMVLWGLWDRHNAMVLLARNTEVSEVQIVNVVKVVPSANQTEIILPGNTRAFYEAGIYARASGYLKQWHVDIGDHVTAGQLLAEIETPELDQQLEQAKADLNTADENEKLAKSTAERWTNLLSDDAVSKQETEQYVSDQRTKKSALESATANLKRIEQLQGFKNLVAPFAGVVTARNTDVGDLINAGSGGIPKELFHLADVSKLRVYVSVPEADSTMARDGAEVGVTLDEFPGKVFKSKVARNAQSIDLATRTLRVEIDLYNPDGEIKTGAYVLTHFGEAKTLSAKPPLILPANALLFRSEGLQVALVKENAATLVNITIGRDFGSTLEVLSGLKEGDEVIVNPSDSLIDGTRVKIAEANTTKQK